MSEIVVPLDVTVALAHAEVQVLAEDQGVDLLHIKGPTLHESLLDAQSPRVSMDADILVRPSHVTGLCDTLAAHGWRRLYDFADGSAFEHAATWVRDDLASVDVHRYFPGIEADPETAFDRVWSDRQRQDIAGTPCWVPSLQAQRLIVLIHAARGRSSRDVADRERIWAMLGPEERSEVDTLARDVAATVALMAVTGRLESVRGERTYPIWRHLTSGDGSLTGLWWARVRSAPSLPSALRIGARMLLPNVHRMETGLGRPPTRSELLRAFEAKVRLAVRTLVSRLTPGQRR